MSSSMVLDRTSILITPDGTVYKLAVHFLILHAVKNFLGDLPAKNKPMIFDLVCSMD